MGSPSVDRYASRIAASRRYLSEISGLTSLPLRQLIQLAKAAESNRAVSGGHYAAAVRIVIVEVERLVGELKSDMTSGGIAIISLLKSIHDALRGLRIDVDPSHRIPNGAASLQ